MNSTGLAAQHMGTTRLDREPAPEARSMQEYDWRAEGWGTVMVITLSGNRRRPVMLDLAQTGRSRGSSLELRRIRSSADIGRQLNFVPTRNQSSPISINFTDKPKPASSTARSRNA